MIATYSFAIIIWLLPTFWLLKSPVFPWKQRVFSAMISLMLLVIGSLVWAGVIELILFSALLLVCCLWLALSTPKSVKMILLATMRGHYLACLAAIIAVSGYELLLQTNIANLMAQPLHWLNLVGSVMFLYLASEYFLQAKVQMQVWEFFTKRIETPISMFVFAILLIKNQSFLLIFSFSHHALFVSVLFLLVTIIELLFVFVTIFAIQTSYRFSLFTYRHEILQESYDLQVETLSQIEAKSQAIRRLSHDVQNHQLVLQELLETNQITQAKRYLASFQAATQLADTEELLTEHPILNALLRQKSSLCQQHEIELQLQIAIGRELAVSDFDLCVIIGNLFDNAIEASQQIRKEQRFICCRVKIVNHNLVFQVENHFSGVVSTKQKQLLTTKADAIWHGVGLQNVQATVAQYGGSFDYEIDQRVFHALVRLPLN